MTAEGHLLFSIPCAVFAKNAELTPVLAQGDWWHIIPSAILTCLLPDIDHHRSLLGRFNLLSPFMTHRGFSHTLLGCICLSLPFLYIKGAAPYVFLGAISHLFADRLQSATGNRMFKIKIW